MLQVKLGITALCDFLQITFNSDIKLFELVNINFK